MSVLGLESLGAIVADPELRALFKSVATRKINADLKTLQAHAELSRHLAKSRKGASFTGAADPLRQIVKEHLEYYGTLIDLSQSFHQRLLDMLAETERTQPGTPPINGLTLALNAPQGATVRAPFKISNNRAETVSVTCRASPFVSEDGTQLIASRIAFAPPGAEIPPGSEEVFEAILPVGRDFLPGRLYLATLTADGFDAMSIIVRLQVAAPVEQPAPAPVPTAAPEASEVPEAPKIGPVPRPRARRRASAR